MLPSLREKVNVACSACPANEDLPTSDRFARGITSSHLSHPNRLVWPSLVRQLGCLVFSHAVLYHMSSAVYLTCGEYKKSNNFRHVDDRTQARGRLHPKHYLGCTFLLNHNHSLLLPWHPHSFSRRTVTRYYPHNARFIVASCIISPR
jgi:hypothetical protein